MTKIHSHMILVLYNVRTVPSNVRKISKPPNVTKNIVTCDVGTVQCEDGTIKCEKKIRDPPNVTKIQSYVMLVLHNVRMV